ncbi:MAG TPA: hypothetical protein PLY93_07020 [Turneriella sp.]|nr:hypothetical protein [Turneriella sp.]
MKNKMMKMKFGLAVIAFLGLLGTAVIAAPATYTSLQDIMLDGDDAVGKIAELDMILVMLLSNGQIMATEPGSTDPITLTFKSKKIKDKLKKIRMNTSVHKVRFKVYKDFGSTCGEILKID